MIKLVLTDIDGVWTDGGMYYDQTGNEWKKFNTSDSAGVLFLRMLKIPLAIITGENTEIVRRRAEKLQIEELHMGIRNKLTVAQVLCEKYKVSMKDVAFIGDDINDLELLQKVGFAACPANAPDYVKAKANVVMKKRGGDGAFREFVEYILEDEGLFEKALDLYLEATRK